MATPQHLTKTQHICKVLRNALRNLRDLLICSETFTWLKTPKLRWGKTIYIYIYLAQAHLTFLQHLHSFTCCTVHPPSFRLGPASSPTTCRAWSRQVLTPWWQACNGVHTTPNSVSSVKSLVRQYRRHHCEQVGGIQSNYGMKKWNLGNFDLPGSFA